MWAWAWAFWIGGVLLGCVGFSLLVRAVQLKRIQARACRTCGYDMTGVPGLQCLECGRLARNERELWRPRWNLRLVFTGVLCVLCALAAAYAPRVHERGWLGATPTLLLALGARFQTEWPTELVIEIVRRVPNGEHLGQTVSSLILPRLLEEEPKESRGTGAPSFVRSALVLRALRALDRKTLETEVLRRIAPTAPKGDRQRTLRAAAVSELSPRLQKKIAEIASDANDPVQFDAALSLGYLARDEALPAVIRILDQAGSDSVDMTTMSRHDFIAELAIKRLEVETTIPAEMPAALWKAVRTRYWLRHAGLVQLLRLEPTRVDDLCAISLFRVSGATGMDPYCKFLHALGERGKADPACMTCLLSHLHSALNSSRACAAIAIGDSGSSDPDVQAELLKTAQSDDYPFVRQAAIVALAKCNAPCSALARVACSTALLPEELKLVRTRFESAGEAIPECLREPAR